MKLRTVWLGRLGYREALALQERLRAEVLAGGEEQLLLLEHDPVVTLGRSARSEHILDADALRARGIVLETSSRGGQVTYHGPGQLVAYAILRLDRGIVAHVEALCDAAVAVAREWGVSARYRRDCPGVWVEERKLASVGVHVHKRVTMHGLALNVATALDPYSLIVACGSGARATSLALESGRHPTLSDAAVSYARAFAQLVGREPFLSAAPPLE